MNNQLRLMNVLLDDLFNVNNVPVAVQKTKVPLHDIVENDIEYYLEFLLAGVKREDINVDVNDDVITVKAERKQVSDLNYNRKETYYGKYEKSYSLPESVDVNNIDVSLSDGILKIIIPKMDVKSKTIKSFEIK